MSDFTLYDINGKIVLTGSCPKEQLKYQDKKGFTLIEESSDLHKDYYCHISQRIKPKPEKPSDLHNFCYKTKSWVLDSDSLEKVRDKRNSLLRDSDWTMLPDSPLSEDEKYAWSVYRKSLRDITDENLEDIAFPVPPNYS